MMRTFRLHRVVGVFSWLVLALTASLVWIGHAQQSATPPADDPRFTGKTSTLDAKALTASRRQFDAGARSAWHSHDNGQLIFVQEGRGRVQKRGQRIRDIGPGESDYTPPGVEHWHGAVPAQALTQVALGFGGETKWKDKVTDAEYAGTTGAAYGSASVAKDSRCFELRTYTAAPGKLDALNARFRNHTNALFRKHGMTIVGFWEPTDIPDTLIYILAYKDRPARDAAWKAFGADPDWVKARTESEVNGRLTAKVESVFLAATDYSPLK